MILPTKHHFVLCQALGYHRRAASASDGSTSAVVEEDCEEMTEVGDLCEQHAIEQLA